MSARTAPAPIRTDSSNLFAHTTIRERLPGIALRVIADNPGLPPDAVREIERLAGELRRDAPLALFDPPAPDWDDWSERYPPYAGTTWQATEWFFAEHLFYRRLIQAVRYWETALDPFAPAKREEYRSEGCASLVESAAPLAGGEPDEALAELLLASLWGNRADLSFRRGGPDGHSPTADPSLEGASGKGLLIDDRSEAVELLTAEPGEVSIVTDNAGSELAMDLLLADALLAAGHRRVFLHLKLLPTFVSDATAADARELIELLRRGGLGPEGSAPRERQRGGRDAGAHRFASRAAGERLAAALSGGRLRLAPDLFWNLPRFLSELPLRITFLLEQSLLVILKGDANYRRLVGDALWPPETPLVEAAPLWREAGEGRVEPNHRLPPMLALRTLKSDPIAGLPKGLASSLDRAEPDWRVSGRRGIAQLRRGSS